MGLLTKCPLEHHLSTCPMKGYRTLPMNERFLVSKQLTEQQIDEIIAHHTRCMNARITESY